MSTPTIQLHGLTVRYGKRTAVDGVTFDVAPGSVYALLGRNGAGKSSLIRCLLGLQRAQAGDVKLFGSDVWRNRAALMQRVGVVGEEADAPPDMTVAALAEFSRRLYARWDAAAVDDRLARFGVAPTARYGDLSKGQKKQVALALALAMSPEMIVLDDPTLGLDVVARKSLFEEVIGELADRGITIFVTTHDLTGVEAIADRVGVLRAGRLVLDEDLETLKGRFRRLRVMGEGPVSFDDAPLVAAAVRSWGTATEAVISNYDELALERFRSGRNVSIVDATPMSLEEIFIAVSGEYEGGQS